MFELDANIFLAGRRRVAKRDSWSREAVGRARYTVVREEIKYQLGQTLQRRNIKIEDVGSIRKEKLRFLNYFLKHKDILVKFRRENLIMEFLFWL